MKLIVGKLLIESGEKKKSFGSFEQFSEFLD